MHILTRISCDVEKYVEGCIQALPKEELKFMVEAATVPNGEQVVCIDIKAAETVEAEV